MCCSMVILSIESLNIPLVKWSVSLSSKTLNLFVVYGMVPEHQKSCAQEEIVAPSFLAVFWILDNGNMLPTYMQYQDAYVF